MRKIGMEVVARIKAPQIIIVTDFGVYRLSARNQLQGTVTQFKPGQSTPKSISS